MTFPSDDDEKKGEESRRRRPKFIRKVECSVCGDTANDHIHYGAIACYSCRAFFRRAVTGATRYECAKTRSCEITKESRKTCQACRLKKCGDAGMKSSWVMTEEEKMDKKLRAGAKKAPDGTTIPKTKPTPKKNDNPNVQPTEGTLQSYMARRKQYLHRKRRQQNQQSSLSTATSSTSTSKTNDKNKFDRNDPLIKIEMNSFEAFEHDSSMEMSFIKMEQDDDFSSNDRKRHSTANTDRMESYDSSGDENSFDDLHFTNATRVKVDTALNSIATSPVLSSFNAMSDQSDFTSSLFRDNHHLLQRQQQQLRQNDNVIGSVEEREELMTSFSPLSNDIKVNSGLAVSPFPSLSNEMKSSSAYNSLAASPSPGYMSNELKVEMSLSPYPPSPTMMSPSFPMSTEIKMEPVFNSLAPSPSGFHNLSSPSPSLQLLGDGDFSSLFNDQSTLNQLLHQNNNNTRQSSSSRLSSLQQLLQMGDNNSMSAEIDLYRKNTDHNKDLINTYLQSDLLMVDDSSQACQALQVKINPPTASTTNDLSLDIFPFDQVWTSVLSPPQPPVLPTMFPIEMTMPFTMEEQTELNRLVRLEHESRRMIPVKTSTMAGIFESIRSGTPLKYDIAKDGYNTCVQRIAHFISKLNAFCAFDREDRKALLRSNVHMVVNLKSARILRPENTLQKQIGFANLTSSLENQREVNAYQLAAPSSRLEYNQVFKSPWCCGEDIEEKYREMMEEMFKLEMDDVTHVLLVATTLFATTGNSRVRERSMAARSQECFIRMLYRYLCAHIGNSNANNVLPKYRKMLEHLEKMADIILGKRLPF